MNHRECWQPCWPYTPARETRGQPSIAPTMPTNTAQSDPTEPLKTADLPLRYAENGASPMCCSLDARAVHGDLPCHGPGARTSSLGPICRSQGDEVAVDR